MNIRSIQSLSSHSAQINEISGFNCVPLMSLKELKLFLKDPPVWRSLCVPLKPHSDNLVMNMDIVSQNHNYRQYEIELERPETFCHSNPDHEDVIRHKRKDLPKTLVCHDMANGYHDDSKTDGTGNSDAYTFYNWAVVDIFCYFSHHFITIPPLGWINVGHEHGVKVIGTVITEWAEGSAVWEKLLADAEEYKSFANALVTIAKILQFDGWLLNIENKVSKPHVLLEFVQYLHALMHRELPDPVLVWYDSVDVEGHLNWQNGLTSKNKAFFDACDGIFTNYTWSEADVVASKVAAGARATDLYIGIDVWGRNFLGGGQFNTQQAVKIAHKLGCSLAIFAPAWTHEAMAEDPISSIGATSPIRNYKKFLLRDRALWGSIWPYLNTKLPKELPFQTSFCRGQGRKRRMYGEVLGPGAWFNVRHQQYQPNSAQGPHGYLLVSRPVSKLGALKESPIALRQRESSQGPKDSLRCIPQEAPPEANTSDDTVQSLERKKTILERLKDLFRRKAKKIEEEREDPSQNATPASVERARLSVEEFSVSLRLGQNQSKTRFGLMYIEEELDCLEVYDRDCFNGGSCIAINPCDETDITHRFVRLFHCDFLVEGTLIACVVTKLLEKDSGQYLNVELAVHDRRSRRRVTLVGRELPGRRGNAVSPILPSSPEFRDLQKYLLVHEPGFYVAIENAYRWKVRYYSVPMAGGRVTSVSCRTGLGLGPVLLGHFALCQRSKD